MAQVLTPAGVQRQDATPAVEAQGFLALLEEEDRELQGHALQKLYGMVDQFWSEIANAVPLIEELSEDQTFAHRELAAALASRCFFHLEEYNDALRLALGAGSFFDVSAPSSSRTAAENQFVDTMVSKCIDEYTSLRTEEQEKGEPMEIDARMTEIVERMFTRCYNDAAWTHAIGVALETLRLDKVKETLEQAPAQDGTRRTLLQYTLDACVGSQQLVTFRDFRLKVLKTLVQVHLDLPEEERDFGSQVTCYQHLNDADNAAKTLLMLLEGSERQELLAYQLAFDISESEDQNFIIGLLHNIEPGSAPAQAPADSGDAPAEGAEGEASAATASADDQQPAPSTEKREKLLRILRASGFTVDLQVNFLHNQSKVDALQLEGIKDALDQRNATLHQATVAAHGFMYAGTASTSFFRKHMDWFGKSSNWASFSATASIGVIHRPKATLEESKAVLEAYLPQSDSNLPFSEGGALLALGLIHAAKAGNAPVSDAESKDEVLPYLIDQLNAAGQREALQQGASIAIGLAAMGTAKKEVFDTLKSTLYNDTAVGGEGAAYGIGLLLLGRSEPTGWIADAMRDLITYAHDTQHEKIIRALSLAMALASFSKEDGAVALIETLARDRDAIIRYGAMYVIGMAYVGTGANSAVRRLLHVAVSDVSDDVRRAAVTNLGFVLFRQPDRLPALVALLAESYNPHVRYGASLALGIGLAGSAGSDAGMRALDMLQQMHEDAVDFVRQGSLMASAMILIQQPNAHPVAKPFREKLDKIIREKHGTTMTKMGAIVAMGILDAGGRNVTLSLSSRSGFTKASAVVGFVLWAQHWYWYPLQHMLGLTFSPTALIGLNKDFNMPKHFTAVCQAKPSQFAYPPMTEVKKDDKKERVETVALSTTARAKAREARKEKTAGAKSGDDSASMEVEQPKAADEDAKEGKAAAAEGDKAAEGTEEKASEDKPKKGPEPSSFELSNPSRVTPGQVKYVEFTKQQRYMPVNPHSKPVGIVMLTDRTPEEAEEVTEVKVPTAADDDDEAAPPAPFEWSPDMQSP